MLHLRPLVVDEEYYLLGGNMRLKALQELGITEVPVDVVSGWSDEQKKEFIIKDNVNYGDWNYSALDDWSKEKLDEWGLTTWSLEPEAPEAREHDTGYEQSDEAPDGTPHEPSMKLLIDFNLEDYEQARKLTDELTTKEFNFEPFLKKLFTAKLKQIDVG